MMHQYIRLFVLLGMLSLSEPVINPDNVLPGSWFIPKGVPYICEKDTKICYRVYEVKEE